MRVSQSPEYIFEELFIDLHASKLWADGKIISDAIPLSSPEEILKSYRKERGKQGFNLKNFFNQYFLPSPSRSTTFKSNTKQPIEQHINQLWDILTREKDKAIEGSSLLPLPYPYIVPGGRFNEIYYWDSYFTQLGLQQSNRSDMIESMVKNFAHLIQSVGHIPNGNRSYFLGRSQPPYFSLMVQLLADVKGLSVLSEFFEPLEKEYRFWMKNEDSISKKNYCKNHCVYTSEGVLNRYWDEYKTPRAEMYQTDIELGQSTSRNPETLFGHLRAACESGWDFSSRWLKDPQQLTSIQTNEIVPVDLNCLLFNLEQTLAKGAKEKGLTEIEQFYSEKAFSRKKRIRNLFWHPETGFFHDIFAKSLAPTPAITLAGIYPLAFGIATQEQADSCAEIIASEFLKDGGVVTTLNTTGQQWDAPNGWAPLQWMTFLALENYGHHELALSIAERWVKLTTKVYLDTGKCLEKYNVVDTSLLSGGGEYAVQDGFGWTNGVILAFQNKLRTEKKMYLEQ